VSEPGGRYNRSFNGLVGAIIITVLAVVAFAVFRGAFSRDIDETERATVDYVDSVRGLQQSGVSVVYPATLPDGWRSTGVDVAPVERPGDVPALGFDLTTADNHYAGIEVVADDAEGALETVYDEGDDIAVSDPLTGTPGLATDWQGWTVGDDHAFTTAYGDRTVVVFGSAGTAGLTDLVGRLTDEPLSGVTPAPTPAS
jgi:hypothetical protein